MSRFFRSASDSESETESSDNESFISDEELSSEEEEESSEEEQVQEEQPKRSRFLKSAGSESEESSDEEVGRRRQIKSQKDKRIEDMQNSFKAIENGQKNNDWGLISSGKKTGLMGIVIMSVIFTRKLFHRIRQVERCCR